MATEVELFEFQDIASRPSIRGYIDANGVAQIKCGPNLVSFGGGSGAWGGITGTLGAGAGLLKAGLSVPRAATGANLLYGTAFGANTEEENRYKGAGIGLTSSIAGEGLGRYAVAPTIDALFRSGVGKRVGGMFGSSAPRRCTAPTSRSRTSGVASAT